jgi:hypothetical protein
MRTFRNPYAERVYRKSVTGLDEEIKYEQRLLAEYRVKGLHRTKYRLWGRHKLDALLKLHRQRNALMR